MLCNWSRPTAVALGDATVRTLPKYSSSFLLNNFLSRKLVYTDLCTLIFMSLKKQRVCIKERKEERKKAWHCDIAQCNSIFGSNKIFNETCIKLNQIYNFYSEQNTKYIIGKRSELLSEYSKYLKCTYLFTCLFICYLMTFQWVECVNYNDNTTA